MTHVDLVKVEQSARCSVLGQAASAREAVDEIGRISDSLEPGAIVVGVEVERCAETGALRSVRRVMS